MSRQKGTKTRHPGVHQIEPPTRALPGRPATLGTYRIRVYVKDPKTGRQRERDRVVQAASAAEAAEAREALRREYLEEREPERPRLTTAAYARSWLATKLPALKPSTRRHYADALDLHILPTLGPLYIDAVGHEDVLRWRDAQKGAPSTVNGRLRVLRNMFADATAELGLPRNPAARVRGLATTTEVDDEASKVLSPTELRELLAAVRRVVPRWYPMTLALATTGARWGELSALQWRDIDFDEGVIRIRRSHWKGQVTKPKTKASRRTIVLDEELAQVLEELRAEQLRKRPKGADGFRWVFPSRAGTLMQSSSIRKPLRKAAIACGLAVEVLDTKGRVVRVDGRVPSAHWFRHTLNSLLRRSAEGIVQRSITGHVTEEMAEHYDRVTVAEKRKAIAGAFRLVRGGQDTGDQRKPGTEPGTGTPDTGKPFEGESSNGHDS